jgi:hypothetical protein
MMVGKMKGSANRQINTHFEIPQQLNYQQMNSNICNNKTENGNALASVLILKHFKEFHLQGRLRTFFLSPSALS